ncbi:MULTISPECIES: molybdopterin-guanine dinucleotide biosynthesis protein B [Anaerotruncus]|uniref:molybdopterin-guanine dinucleotide biosynthesis protein B n=1 Tax=Anaerotruncus TaxID=244127 RepID=UPI00083521C5|nr:MULTISPECIES: molybdopterin-guanine dinucleotide biosynthesis protein B [Anaerotruncus]RGX56693.1 molybdopterin-guanine dinucleotide biosynthesis protein B [Anaerotruncus sp. AF02-27]
MHPMLFAVSGVKNSGKTTLTVRLVRALTEAGFRVATIKHDGHDFSADLPGTDSYRHKQAGAVSTIIYSHAKLLMVRDREELSFSEICAFAPDCDFLILEGGKSSPLPKIEVVRAGISVRPVCDPATLLAIATDLPLTHPTVPVLALDDLPGLVKIILHWKQNQEEEPS